MIILGDISGIQNYVFDVAEDGGGQAQRLRARSFFVQLVAETAILRVLRALDLPLASILISGAGKFLLQASCAPDVKKRLAGEQQTMSEWLLRETRGELRLTLAWADSVSEAGTYHEAQWQLQLAKARPWPPMQPASWDPARFLFAPLDTPCGLCGHAPAREKETDRDTGQVRRVCRTCFGDGMLGRRLPRARWLIIMDTPQSADFEILGLGVAITSESQIAVDSETLAVANLGNQEEGCPSWCPPQRFLKRQLMAYVPTDEHGCPVWFTELARQAQGDRLLAVLKADADSLGVRLHNLLDTAGLEAMKGLSEKLDVFFAGKLRKELRNEDGRWQSIYTIFAGGDDLVMVGPWDVMFAFAGEIHRWFTNEFHSYGLTLSASVALMKPKRPIKGAVAEAERLLELAKTGTKDQLAAFGQVWKWQHHDDIVKAARQLVEWVKCGEMERGWLHTLLELAQARHGPTPDPLATARLAYHVFRNYRRNTRARRWAEGIVQQFDNPEQTDIGFLPAIVRYALTATRTREE